MAVCDTHVYVFTDMCAVLMGTHTHVCLGLWRLAISAIYLVLPTSFTDGRSPTESRVPWVRASLAGHLGLGIPPASGARRPSLPAFTSILGVGT